MATILGIDLGKLKSVACTYDPETQEATYATIPTEPDTLKRTLERHRMPALFVTHDPQEAQVVGDHLVRFERGRTVEQGLPRELLASRAWLLRN